MIYLIYILTTLAASDEQKNEKQISSYSNISKQNQPKSFNRTSPYHSKSSDNILSAVENALKNCKKDSFILELYKLQQESAKIKANENPTTSIKNLKDNNRDFVFPNIETFKYTDNDDKLTKLESKNNKTSTISILNNVDGVGSLDRSGNPSKEYLEVRQPISKKNYDDYRLYREKPKHDYNPFKGNKDHVQFYKHYAFSYIEGDNLFFKKTKRKNEFCNAPPYIHYIDDVKSKDSVDISSNLSYLLNHQEYIFSTRENNISRKQNLNKSLNESLNKSLTKSLNKINIIKDFEKELLNGDFKYKLKLNLEDNVMVNKKAFYELWNYNENIFLARILARIKLKNIDFEETNFYDEYGFIDCEDIEYYLSKLKIEFSKIDPNCPHLQKFNDLFYFEACNDKIKEIDRFLKSKGIEIPDYLLDPITKDFLSDPFSLTLNDDTFYNYKTIKKLMEDYEIVIKNDLKSKFETFKHEKCVDSESEINYIKKIKHIADKIEIFYSCVKRFEKFYKEYGKYVDKIKILELTN